MACCPTQLIAMAQRIAKQRMLSLEVVNAHPTFGDDAPDNVVKNNSADLLRLVGLQTGRVPLPTRLFASSKTLVRTAGMELDAIDPGQYLFADATERPIIRSLRTVLIQVRAVTRDFAPEHAPFDIGKVRRVGVIPFGKVDGGGRCHASTFWSAVGVRPPGHAVAGVYAARPVELSTTRTRTTRSC